MASFVHTVKVQTHACTCKVEVILDCERLLLHTLQAYEATFAIFDQTCIWMRVDAALQMDICRMF